MSKSKFAIAVLVKQVPLLEELSLRPDGRLRREGPAELNPYCRRAISKGVELAAQTDGHCTVICMGPPSAEDCVREAIAWGADAGILVCDPILAGSDTLSTARTLAAAIRLTGPFDVVLTGRNSVDADTGQVGPQIAELLAMPFLAGVRRMTLVDNLVKAECELDDGWLSAEVELPAILSCAERLCDPAKVDPPKRALVDARLIRCLTTRDLGPGPWGFAGSPTRVGEVKAVRVVRRRLVLDGPTDQQVQRAVEVLSEAGALRQVLPADFTPVPEGRSPGQGPVVVVLIEPERQQIASELLGAAARLASQIGGAVHAVVVGDSVDIRSLSRRGADAILLVCGVEVEEDIARTIGAWCDQQAPWAILASSTTWGREVASRIAAHLGAGLTGDAVDLSLDGDRVVGWKPAFGGSLVAAITASSETQMITVRPGVLPLHSERSGKAIPVERLMGRRVSRLRLKGSARNDDVASLAIADVVVSVGLGVVQADYPLLCPLISALSAEIAGTRKVTDRGWLPHSKQIGITGRSINPNLYVAIGVSGKFNHMVGVRAAGLVLAINSDPAAPVFEQADVGIVGRWQDVVPLLAREIAAHS